MDSLTVKSRYSNYYRSELTSMSFSIEYYNKRTSQLSLQVFVRHVEFTQVFQRSVILLFQHHYLLLFPNYQSHRL